MGQTTFNGTVYSKRVRKLGYLAQSGFAWKIDTLSSAGRIARRIALLPALLCLRAGRLGNSIVSTTISRIKSIAHPARPDPNPCREFTDYVAPPARTRWRITSQMMIATARIMLALLILAQDFSTGTMRVGRTACAAACGIPALALYVSLAAFARGARCINTWLTHLSTWLRSRGRANASTTCSESLAWSLSAPLSDTARHSDVHPRTDSPPPHAPTPWRRIARRPLYDGTCL